MKWFINIKTNKWIWFEKKKNNYIFTKPVCSNWNQEPNSWGGNEDCAAILPNYNWNDEDCTLSFQYICEYPNLNQGTEEKKSRNIYITMRSSIIIKNIIDKFFFSYTQEFHLFTYIFSFLIKIWNEYHDIIPNACLYKSFILNYFIICTFRCIRQLSPRLDAKRR